MGGLCRNVTYIKVPGISSPNSVFPAVEHKVNGDGEVLTGKREEMLGFGTCINSNFGRDVVCLPIKLSWSITFAAISASLSCVSPPAG